MSRTFTKDIANFLNFGTSSIASLINGASQVSIHQWLYANSFTGADNDNRTITVAIDGLNGGVILCTTSTPFWRVGGRSQAADGFQVASSTTTPVTGVWVSLGGVLDFANDKIYVYVNGVLEKTQSVTFGASTYTLGTPTGGDKIGAGIGLATNTQFDGNISQTAIWTSDIGVGGFSLLGKGYSPFRISASTLIFYAPLLGTSSPEPDMVSGKLGTITGSVPASVDPLTGLPQNYQTIQVGNGLSVSDKIR